MRRVMSWRAAGSWMLALLPSCSSTEIQDCDRNGFSVGAGVGYGFNQFDLDREEADIGQNITVENARAAEVRIGYRFHPNFGIDGVVQYYNDFEFDVSHNSVGNASGYAGTINLKGYLLRGPLQPYAFAGIGALNLTFHHNVNKIFDHNDTELLGRAGLGVDAYLTRNVVLYAEGAYNIPTDALRELDFISIAAGIQYRF